MAKDHSALLTMLADLHDTTESDRIRTITEHACQALTDAEAAHAIGAGPDERTDERVALRNGTRARVLSTTAGDLQLRIPKLRAGTFYPSLLERRRRIAHDQAALASDAAVPQGSLRPSTAPHGQHAAGERTTETRTPETRTRETRTRETRTRETRTRETRTPETRTPRKVHQHVRDHD